MSNDCIVFEDGELEIALVTYNRCDFVAEWLNRCYEQLKKRNIHISIYDSSTNKDTENYINDFKAQKIDMDIEYSHVASNIPMGYKPMLPLLHSAFKYVWVAGDSRCHDFRLLDQKLFPYLKQDVDFALIYCSDNEKNDGKIYTDKDEFLVECLYSLSCIGLSIYKTALFEPLKTDPKLRAACDKKYKDNEGFGWLGYFMELFSITPNTAVTSWIPIINLQADKKVVFWYKKYYSILIEDLCNMMDGLSDKYESTERAIRGLWTEWLPDSSISCYQACKHGDWNSKTYRKYEQNGMLDRCTLHKERMEHFANASCEELDKVYEQEWAAEQKEFEELCCQNLERIKEAAKGRELWIYGAGSGGKILSTILTEHHIPICGFLDQNASSIQTFQGLPVKNLDYITPQNCYIVISLRGWGNMCIGHLLNQGLKREQIFYVRIDGN